MATINPAGFASVPLAESDNLTVSLVAERPVEYVILGTPQRPGKLVGYFNPNLNMVELFVIAGTGTYWLKVG